MILLIASLCWWCGCLVRLILLQVPRALGLPLSTDMPIVPPRPEPKSLTVPEPFGLASEVGALPRCIAGVDSYGTAIYFTRSACAGVYSRMQFCH